MILRVSTLHDRANGPLLPRGPEHRSIRASVVRCWREGVHRVSMGSHHPADDEISVRSPRGSGEHQMAESPRRPVSVIRVVANAGEPKSTEDSLVPRTGDPIEGSWTVLTERRCRSTHPDEDPESGNSSGHAEQHAVGVDGSPTIQGMRRCAMRSTRRVDRANFGV